MMKYDLGKNEFKNWIVSEIKFEEKYIGKTEAIFALGNGYIGLRSANEERYLYEKRDLFISGTFNKANKNEVTELPNVADVTEIEILINGKHLMLNASNNKEYVKYLNLKTGELNRTFVYLDEEGNEYADNGERAIFFARGVLETVKKLRWVPDIIHCQGWMSAVVPLYIKTAYHDEPSFAKTKIVTSLFNEQPKGELGSKFRDIVAFRDAKPELMKCYDEKFDFLELGKLALDYSDCVIEANKDVNNELLKYANNKSIPVLDYPGEDFIGAYNELYEKICPTEE